MDGCVEEPNIPYGEDIPQGEADRLLKLEKIRTSDDTLIYPSAGQKLEIAILSLDEQENFILSVVPGKIDITVTRNQLRTKTGSIRLARLDTGTKTHTNPDGTTLQCPHLHIFKEGFGIRFAIPIDPQLFPNPNDPWKILQDFMTYCNITKKPLITKGADQWS